MQNKELTSFKSSFSGARGVEEKTDIVQKAAGKTVPSKKKQISLEQRALLTIG